MKLAHDRGGEGPRLLVLLHGLGATRNVWRGLIAEGRWQGRWIAPDLRGHGDSPHGASYALADHAGDVAELVDGADVTVLGHSMGGAVALELASGGYGFVPARVFGLGIKLAWTADELAGMAKMAASKHRLFATRDEAIARHLRVAGLSGLVPHEDGARGVTRTDEGWRLAQDPAVATVGAPRAAELLAAARAPVHLARGAGDTMVTRQQLLAHDAGAADLPGGHNAMVEHPAAVWDWVEAHCG
ncbi:MAG TPA: alpha/beta hydrolase [Rhizomicrobium sp.]|nr:alpha/beta hydrolase [Rhizomicrobium sp.]